jgi:hypothetical protein
VEFGLIDTADEGSDPTKRRELLSQRQRSIQENLAFSNTAVIHYSANVVFIESVLVIIIRRRIKVLFIWLVIPVVSL